MGYLRSKPGRAVAALLLVLLVLVGVGMATHVLPSPWWNAADSTDPPTKDSRTVDLVKGTPHTISVADEVLRSLGIRNGDQDRIAVASKPVRTRPLVMPGSTAFDPAKLVRVRIRFTPADVVRIGQIVDPHHSPGSPASENMRDLQSGDRVKRGQLLSTMYSVDVGNKKNDLFDALSQLRLDQEVLTKAREKAPAVPDVFIWQAERNVEADINLIHRAENMLYTWEIPEADIQAVRDAAAKVANIEDKRKLPREKIDDWARVDLRSPVDGVLVEQNVSLRETVIDNTTNLYQVVQVDPLVVYANVPEDDLPELESLKSATKNWIDWTVTTVGSKPIPGYVDDIGVLIDPSQHTAVIKGHIPNPDGVLRAGQFVTCSVELRPPKDVVEVPNGAIYDDGDQSLVFVQEDSAKPVFTLRRVDVTHRFDHTSYVRSTPLPKDDQMTPDEAAEHLLPKQPLNAGERVIETGVVELSVALHDLESQSKSDGASTAKSSGEKGSGGASPAGK